MAMMKVKAQEILVFFRGLVNFVESLNTVLHEHLQAVTVFQGTSETVQNEPFDYMLSVLKECIISEIRGADFVSLQADESMDISTQCQVVLVICFIDKAHDNQDVFFVRSCLSKVPQLIPLP